MDILQTLGTILLFVLVLGTLVLIHEIGHFVVARLARVRVLEFGIGFPPRARVLRSTGETLYTLNWLPIGGFVRLEGEDGDTAGDPRAFSAQSLPIRLIILVAGVVMNLVLAFAIFATIAFAGDPALGIVAGRVQPESPAATAGVRDGDVLVSVNGTRYSAFGTRSILDDLRGGAGSTITLGIERDGAPLELTVTLRDAAAVEAGRGALGVEQLSAGLANGTVSYTATEAIGLGVERTVGAVGMVLDGLGQLVTSIITDPTAPPPAAGPVGIAVQLGDIFWALGPVVTLYLAGILSANLAVFNVLPIPPLDGGRMLMMLIKAVFGARVSLQVERLTYVIGFVFLFAFLIWVTGFDILRQVGG